MRTGEGAFFVWEGNRRSGLASHWSRVTDPVMYLHKSSMV